MSVLYTGFKQLDDELGEVDDGSVVVVAARPCMGKTSFALSVAYNNTINFNKRCLVFSLEKDAKSFNKFTNSNVMIDDKYTMTIEYIANKCRQINSEHKLDLIVIDYIQLIMTKYKNDRNKEYNHLCQQINALAKELNTTIIILTQLGRDIDHRLDHTPNLNDLNNVSNSLVEMSDIVILLYNEDYYLESKANKNLSDKSKKQNCIIIYKRKKEV